MNSFDVGIVHFFNRFAGRWPRLDLALQVLASFNLFKGGVIMALVWGAWGCRRERLAKRELIISTLIGVVLALAAARLLAHLLPLRLRPLHEPALHFQPPFGLDQAALAGWSAFPSDHATLFFGLATGLLLTERLLGIAAFAYTALFIALPRVYLGFHYPTDLIAGGLLGSAIVGVACMPLARERLARPLVALGSRNPGLFHAAVFLVTFQVANLFEAARAVFWSARR